MTFIKEFKQFISRGNVIDIAIGFIMGAAFKEISNSLSADIIMPPVGLLIENVNFTELVIPLKPAVVSEDGQILKPAVGIYYGKLLQSILNFLIISFAVFLIYKLASYYKKKEEVKNEPPTALVPVKSDETVLLEQIRDLLKQQQK